MATENEAIVRSAFEALGRGDLQGMLEHVDEDLEWTFLDPSRAAPTPQVCRGRQQLGRFAKLAADGQGGPQLEELVGHGDRVLVVTRVPGTEERRAWATDDHNFHVVTVRQGRITALRACRNREEAERTATGQDVGTSASPTDATDGAPTAGGAPMALLAAAIRAGEIGTVERIVAEHPSVLNGRLGGENGRTPLHIATDWPGFFPNAPEIVRLLMAAGADPDLQPASGERDETPLHWAASSGDVEVAAALVAGGADVDAPGGSIGTPIENAVGYGCFGVARLLLASGARVDKLWVASALGLRERLEELIAAGDHDQEAIDQAFWHACQGGQRRVAEYLLRLGADVNAHPEYTEDLPFDAVQAVDTEHGSLAEWLESVGARSAKAADAAG